MATEVQIAKILGGLATLYPRFKLEKATITAYCRVLGDIPVEVLDAAALQVGATHTFFPSASELRQAAFELVEVARQEPSGHEAWGEVCRAIGTCGRYRVPEWSNPLVREAVSAVGGWLTLCDSTNPTADRARFIQAYERLADRQRTVTRMLPRVRQVVVQLAEAKRPALPAGNDLAGAFFGINAGAVEGVIDADKDAASQAEGANGRSQVFARKQ